MSTFHKLHVHALDGNSISHRITLDGRPVRCRSLDLHLGINEIPTATLEVLSVSDAEELAEAGVMYHPASVEEAHAILRGALLTNKDLRAAWIASVAAAIEEAEDDLYVDELAEVIVDTLIGEVDI